MTPLPANAARPIGWVAAAVVLSWMGEVVHNRIELPGLTLLSPENWSMAAVAALLFLLWWALPARAAPCILLLSLGLLHLIGGAMISVLPLPILPFAPEQSVAHYLTHLLYGLAQLPLIILMIGQMRRPRPAGAHP